MREIPRAGPWLIAGALTGGLAVFAAEAQAEPLDADLGSYSRPITTTSKPAQDAFDQGLRLAYGFARAEAIDSFKQAQAYDPACAMCAWGEAWVTGPYQNNPAGVGDETDAWAAAERAHGLATDAAPWEQALIAAMRLRYRLDDGPDHDAGKRAYAEAMRQAAAAHPRNTEVQTLHAEAQMMLRPWRLYRDDGSPFAATVAATETLEGVLAVDLDHPGACHLYIHAVEAARPRDAEACADQLAAVIPAISHVQHMPSHIYVHVGRYRDAVTANKVARAVDRAAEHGEGVAIYPTHNTMMLMFSAWLDGQSAVAIAAARDLAVERPEDVHQQYLMLARFGRWEALLAASEGPESAFQNAMWRFARGLAQLRTGDRAGAQAALEQIVAARETTDPEATYHFFGHSQRRLLGIAENTLAGEILAATGEREQATDRLRAAVALEDGLGYSEPEPWPLPARDFLGARLLEDGRAAEAEQVYRQALADHAANGWALTGLLQSLAMQDQLAEAEATERLFEQAWQRADVTLAASRF
jgi:tetratricopeptide (TPR) repeat protein